MRSPLSQALLFSLFITASVHARIIDGTDARAHDFSEVFAITYADEDSVGAKRICTAVLIHPEILLTAAQCLPKNSDTPITAIRGANIDSPIATYVSTRSTRNASYFTTQDTFARAAFNVGVVILDQPITDVKPAPLASLSNAEDANNAVENGVHVVGFGGKKTMSADETTGVKRYVKTRVLEAGEALFTTEGPKSGLSNGDLGGPAYIFDRTGHRHLIGIASSPLREDISSQPKVSLYVGLRPALIAWIELLTAKTLPTPPKD